MHMAYSSPLPELHDSVRNVLLLITYFTIDALARTLEIGPACKSSAANCGQYGVHGVQVEESNSMKEFLKKIV